MTLFHGKVLLLAGALLVGTITPINAADSRASEANKRVEPDCSAPKKLLPAERRFTNTTRRIRQSNSLYVVVIGGASMAGLGTSNNSHALPAQLKNQLARQLPRLALTVTDLSNADMEITQVPRLLRQAVIPKKPDLIIWQIGLKDMAAHMPVSDFNEIIDQSLDIVETGQTIDFVLMDAPYYDDFDLLVPTIDYRDVIRWQASYRGMALVDTADLVLNWQHAAATATERSDNAHYCLAKIIVQPIVRASREK